jgi:hypothetical protein
MSTLSMLATGSGWQSDFLAVLPAVQTHAAVCFRRLRPEQRAEASAEAVASAFTSYGTLARQGKLHQAFPSTLARFAVRAVRSQRHVGGHQSARDALSPLAQKRHHFAATSISPWDRAGDEGWRDLLLPDRHVSPADAAAFNIDFQEWLSRWSPRHRHIITVLADGHSTKAVATRFRVTPGGISHLRRHYQRSWECYQASTPSEAV